MRYTSRSTHSLIIKACLKTCQVLLILKNLLRQRIYHKNKSGIKKNKQYYITCYSCYVS